LVIVSALAGSANALFMAAYFSSRNVFDLFVSWVFGTALAMCVGKIASSMSVREGWEPLERYRKL
jgi:hypothetical protein